MAYIRKVRTASGAIAVQVAVMRDQRHVVLEHVGSAHTDAELGVLLAEAEKILLAGQQVFDLGVEAAPVSMEGFADWRAPAQPTPQARRRVSHQVLAGQGETATKGRTTGPFSGLLYEVLGQVYDRLGFNQIDSAVFRDLVIARIVEPGSKKDAARVLADLGVEPAASYSTIQRHLKRAVSEEFRSVIAAKCFDHATQTGGLSLILYDVTTLYFETDEEDSLRKIGFSKERRVDPQVVIGLLVDRTGFPLQVHCFAGDKPETHTLIPVIKAFQDHHQVADMVVVADAGMLSDANLTALEEAGLRFIVGSRIAKAPYDLAGHFENHGTFFRDGQIVETTTSMGRARTKRRVVYQYSRKRFVRDNQTINAQQQRAMDFITGVKTAKKARFVKTQGTKHALDQTALHKAKDLAGLKGYVTNIEAELMSGSEVIGSYHALFQVERSFRMSKRSRG